MTATSARRLRAPLTTAGLVLAAVGVDVAVDPVTTHIPLCPFHSMTGWWCPLCGGLRAVFALCHGDLRTAVHDNAVFVALVPVLIWLWWDSLGRARRGAATRRLPRAAVAGLVALGVLFTVVRNLPGMAALRPLS